MTATGIPPHVALMHCMEDLRNDFAVLRAEMVVTMKEVIEENDIAAVNASISQIQTLLAANREAYREFLRQILLSNGIGNAAPATTTLDNMSKVYTYGGKLCNKILENYTLPKTIQTFSWFRFQFRCRIKEIF
jgi:hypothetical protein